MSGSPDRAAVRATAARRRDGAAWLVSYVLIILIGAALAGVYIAADYFPRLRREAVAGWRARLDGLVEDRQAAITVWLDDARRDLRAITASPEVVQIVRSPVGTGTAPPVATLAVAASESTKRVDFTGLLLFDGSLALRAASTGAAPSGAGELEIGRVVLAARQVSVQFSRRDDGQAVVLFAAPVLAAARPIPAGVVVLVVDPRAWLFPLLRREPQPTATGEVVLSAREGDRIVVLSPLRYSPSPPRPLTFPLLGSRMAAAQALAGRSLFDRFVDYRGVPVLASVRPLPGVPWGLVAKADEAEVLAAFRAQARDTRAIGLLALIAAVAAGVALWRGLRASHYRVLAASERQVAELFEHGPDAGLVLTDGMIAAANDAAGELFRCPREELLGTSAVRLIRRLEPDDDSMEQALRAAPAEVEPGRRRRLDWRCRRHDGSDFDAEVSLVTLAGSPPRLLIWLRDVTSERTASERLRLLVESSPRFFFYVQELDGSLSYVSPSVERITGHTVEEWGRRHDWFTTDSPLNAVARARTQRNLRGDVDPEPILVELWHADGHAVTLEVNEFARYSGQRLVGLHGIAHDVSDRRRMESALRESEERFRSLVDSLGEGVSIVDAAERVLFANPAAEAIFGVTPGSLVGHNLAEFLTPESQVRVRDETARRRNGEVGSYEVEIVRPDGARRAVLVTATPQRSQRGEFEGVFGIFRDVTTERSVEAQLLQAQKMEAIGLLAGGIAHDFNNLLQVLLSLSEGLSSRADDAEQTRRAAVAISEHVRRGAGLARQLLLFSRRETTSLAAVDLGDVVRQSGELLARLLRANIAVRLDTPGPPLPVRADRGQLEQVLINLAVNAADAMPDGGVLAITCGREDGGLARLEVRDSGHGIPADIRTRIFEPFFTTKGAGQGTGLGLSVVHGIVTGHGGHIVVESEPGAGATFRITLPITQEAVPDHSGDGAGRVPASPPAPGERVLVVEDEPAAREGLADALSMLGYAVTAVASGEEAGLLPHEPTFDVLLTDFLLPGVNGADLARGLCDRWPELRVVLMSGYTEDDAVREAVRSGSMRFLQKPFTIDTVARELRAALAPTGSS